MRPSIISVFLLLIAGFLLPNVSWAADEEAPAKAIYYRFPKPIVINFLKQSNQDARYLQIKVALMSHDQAYIDSAKLNLPMLEDALRTLFTEQTMDSVSSTAGRNALKEKSADIIKSLLEEETGVNELDGLYFTSFILQ